MPCKLVYVIFSSSELPDSKWQEIQEDITSHLTPDLTGCEQAAPLDQRIPKVESRFLAPGHVKELTITTARATPATLAECTTFNQQSASGQRLQQNHNIQTVLQPAGLYSQHSSPGLAVFDMDSTLIQQEVIDELARAVGLYDQVAAITEAAMRGEEPYTDFETSLRARVALLKGVQTSIWEQLKAGTITFTPGAKELALCLKQLGWKTAVLSGGFTPLANWVKETLGLDVAFANHLVADADAGLLTGELVPGAPIIHGEKKRELLLQLAAENGVPVERTIAVGDGSNDLPMMHASGFGLAFNAKPKVQLAAPAKLNGSTLLQVMHVLGYTKDEVDGLLAKGQAA
ncbi:phosphoserine phosphatase serb [Hortaea werneckii]|nr:phosphoserine phosphatase serb [Hortaea werneckii]